MNIKDLNESQKKRFALEVLEIIDDLEFEKDMKDFQESRADKSVRIPSREQILAMTRKYGRVGKPTKASDWLKAQVQTIASKFANNFVPEPVLADTEQKLNDQVISCGGKLFTFSVFIQSVSNKIEIYTSDEKFKGKELVVSDGKGEIARCPFEADDTRKGMKFVAFFRISQNIELEQIINLELNIPEKE